MTEAITKIGAVVGVVITLVTLGLALGLAMASLFAWALMLLWGAIAPQFGWPTIGFWLMLSITVAVSIMRQLLGDNQK